MHQGQYLASVKHAVQILHDICNTDILSDHFAFWGSIHT